MKLHERTLPVQRAEVETKSALLDIQERHDLTDIEMIRILAAATSRWSMYALRAERHPDDPSRKADEE